MQKKKKKKKYNYIVWKENGKKYNQPILEKTEEEKAVNNNHWDYRNRKLRRKMVFDEDF